MSDRDWRPGNPVWEDLQEEGRNKTVKEVPLVVYDEDGNSRPIGTAQVEIREDGLHVRGIIDNEDGVPRIIEGVVGINLERTSGQEGIAIDPNMVKYFKENPPIRIEER